MSKAALSGKYAAYPEYKDSGVEWVGSIPSTWEMWKLSHAYELIGSGTTPTSNNEKWFQGNIPWITTGELRENIITDTTKKVSSLTIETFTALKIYPKGSIAIAMYGATIGRLGILGVDATTNQACCVMTKSKVLQNKYLFYWLQAFKDDIVQLSSGGGQPNINQEKVAALKISAPVVTEQTQIAAFLDHETAKIDTLIEKQQQLIELLKEKRQAVISHAVTKGLNPDAPMKDSGVEWLGEVPEHWCVSRLKYYTKQIVDGAHFTPTYTESGVPFLRVTDIQSKFIDLNQIKYIPQAEHNELIKRCNPKKGDLLLSKNGTIGVPKIVDWDWDFSIFVSLCLLKLKEPLSAEYAEYFFKSHELKEQIFGLIKQSTVINLHLDKIQNFWFCIPPRAEQDEIVASLNHDIGNLDLLINKATDAIHIMQERRTALISAAVTGKIDVRGFTLPSQENDIAQEYTAAYEPDLEPAL